MPDRANLLLELVDVFGDPLGEPVEIRLSNQNLTHNPALRGVDSSRPIPLTGLFGPPNGLYTVEVTPPSHFPVRQFVRLTGTDNRLRMMFAVNPSRVSQVVFPGFDDVNRDARTLLAASGSVDGFEGKTGAGLYGALDDIRRAGLLNIVAKCDRTRFPGNASVLSFFQELEELRGDRFFVRVPKSLREATKNSIPSGLFHEVNGGLHRPPDGFTSAGSYKTDDPEGNLQLTFFANASNQWMADVDIDDANGLAHVFQVLRNAITGRPTHPYDIHQILIATQELDPGYRFVLAGAAEAVRVLRAPRQGVVVRRGRRR